MNIAGVIVHALPENLQVVREQLLTLPGVEVHAATATGRLVVTVEEHEDSMLADTVMQFQDLEGVLSAAMIYHHYESNPIEQEASR